MGEYCLLLSNIVLQDGLEDKWDWSVDLYPGKGYFVRASYDSIYFVVQFKRSVYCDTVWNKR